MFILTFTPMAAYGRTVGGAAAWICCLGEAMPAGIFVATGGVADVLCAAFTVSILVQKPFVPTPGRILYVYRIELNTETIRAGPDPLSLHCRT